MSVYNFVFLGFDVTDKYPEITDDIPPRKKLGDITLFIPDEYSKQILAGVPLAYKTNCALGNMCSSLTMQELDHIAEHIRIRLNLPDDLPWKLYYGQKGNPRGC